MTSLLGLSLRALAHRLAPVVAATVIAGTAATAWAYWTTNAAAGSTGAATAATVNQGATPSVTLTSRIVHPAGLRITADHQKKRR